MQDLKKLLERAEQRCKELKRKRALQARIKREMVKNARYRSGSIGAGLGSKA